MGGRRKLEKDCYFCGKERTDEGGCASNCKCSQCVFPHILEDWGEKNPVIRDFYLKNNTRFYEILFESAKQFEIILFDGWRQKQLEILKHTKTNVGDWTSQNEPTNSLIYPTKVDKYKIIRPFYESEGFPEGGKYPFHCQICGENLIRRTLITNEKTLEGIFIGLDCDRNFRLSELLYRNMKEQITDMIRRNFHRNKRKISGQKQTILKEVTSKTKRKEIRKLLKKISERDENIDEETPSVLVNALIKAKKLGFKIELI